MAAILAGEPWCLTPAEIGKLTFVQAQELYFRARDKNGHIRRDPDKIPKGKTPREEFVSHWLRWGVSRERAVELWREKRKAAKEKKADKAKPKEKVRRASRR